MKRILLTFAYMLYILTTVSAQDLTQLVEKVSPSIFKIITYDATGAELGVGTGFFISSTGNALTNYHVLQGASKAKVKTFDNKTYIIENIIGWSQESDIVKFSVRNELNETFPFLKLNANAPKAGEKIFIVGNPLGLDKSVSDGIVSSVRQDDLYGETIQVTAPISQGNSGSPLMNMQGEALGVVTYYLKSGQNLNFAVSVKNLNIIEPVNALKYPPADNQKVLITNNKNNEIKKDDSNNYNDPSSTFYYINSKVKFCTELDGSQLPKNPGEVFYINPSGSWIYVWVGNDKKLATSQLIVDVYRKKNGEYDDFVETKYYDITSTWEDTHFKYTFYNPGDYKISIYTKDNVWINSGFVTIKSNSDNTSNYSTTKTEDKYNDPSSTFYYMNSKVQFCLDLDENQFPVNPGTAYKISKDGSWIYIHVQNDKKLATSQLIVDVYKKKNGAYTEFVETKRYDITPTWSDTHFKYTFYKAGDYKISVYSKDNVWINSGYVTISYK